MSEVFAEQIIKSKTTLKALLVRIAMVFLVLLSFLSFAFLRLVAITVIIIAIYVAVYVISLTSVEYEYSLVNSDLTVSMIMGQKKRKKLADYDFRKAESMFYVSSADFERVKGNLKIQDFSSHGSDSGKVAVVFKSAEEDNVLVFEPNERIINNIKRLRPGLVKNIEK